jgi:Transglycosylase-like domain
MVTYVKNRGRPVLLALFASILIPAIAWAHPGKLLQPSSSSRGWSAPAPVVPTAYRDRSFWDGGEAGHLAYVASLDQARARSARSTERVATVAEGGPGPVVYSGSPDWYAIAACESGGRWDLNSGNGYWGGLQFAPSSWFAYGGGPFDGVGPFPYSADEQIAVAEAVYAGQGPSAWPNCFTT